MEYLPGFIKHKLILTTSLRIRHIVFLICFGLSVFGSISFGQNSISGVVRDYNSGETIIGAVVYDSISKKGTITNSQGYFNLEIRGQDKVVLIIKMIGYKDTVIQGFASRLQNKTFEIRSDRILNMVVVRSNKPIEERTEIGVVKIPIEQIRKLPTITGEFDILKAYQLMPGVSAGKEGTSGLFVRGGSPDQNLFLLDGMHLYYVNHIGGFVSVFDINAVNDMSLYKGGFPAKYGGRISSVMDFQMKEGNSKKFKGEIGIGLLSAKGFIEGPIKKDTTTFFLSARRSILDLFTRPFTAIASSGQAVSGYTFYDINGKLTHRFKNNGKLEFVSYFGRDKIFINSGYQDETNNFRYKFKNQIKWGNIMGQLKYTRPLTSKSFFSISGGVTRFSYNTDISARQETLSSGDELSESSVNFISGVFDALIKTSFEFYLPRSNHLTIGLEGVNHNFKPGISSKIDIGSQNYTDSAVVDNRINSQEFNFYVQNEFKIGKRVASNVGLHLNGYFVEGEFLYSLQPRVLLSYLITENLAVKAGYSRMNQNIHLLSNSGTGIPTDLWVPATANLPPEIADQYNVAFEMSVGKDIEITAEGFWKELSNLIDYKDGSNFMNIGSDWESTVTGNGKGEIIGLEFLIRKTQGKFQGWLGYTLSKNTRVFPEINNGEKFFYQYDKRHDLSVVGIYHFNDKVSLSGTWVFNTGNPITLANEKYNTLVPGVNFVGTGQSQSSNNLQEAHLYNGKNSYRLPSYHRMDLSVSLTKQKKRGTRIWNFGIYNVYNRLNPFFLYYKKIQDEVKLYQLSLFPIIPSFSYTFQFN